MYRYFKPGQTVLFQGDSITDCARRDGCEPFGFGYANKIKNIYNELFSDAEVSTVNRVSQNDGYGYPPVFADSGVNFVNRGVSGDRAHRILGRFDEDILAVKPDFISILVGVNEVYHHLPEKPNSYYPPERYEESYKKLLLRIREELPKTEIMVIEPFLIPSDNPLYEQRKTELRILAAIARDLAMKHADRFVPMWGIYNDVIARKEATPVSLSWDGVHPTPLGHTYIANAYLKALGIL